MPLKPSMSIREIEEYLKDDLKVSLEHDVLPVLEGPGGYFGVARAVLCYVDFLGALYRGYKGGKACSDRKQIATSKKATAFISEILGHVDHLYQTNGKLLYEMYRHGTVHLYAPKELKRKRRILSWMPYKEGREAWLIVDNRARLIRHLKPLQRDGKSDWLPVSITCLYHDLRAAIDEFARRLSTDQQLFDNWQSAAAALCEPECTELGWSTDDPC